ncbi:hypothetical protein DFH07DRAFT_965826 [Mycena maculata]|uniref:Uncharacterized protein n=1 Tax=Mycena maculata TaxID=230809 RepID=A0AAD7IBD9_9AGAR|nr:hypothetical protein DFH07DRAFT_965826 [Mycena maculata]
MAMLISTGYKSQTVVADLLLPTPIILSARSQPQSPPPHYYGPLQPEPAFVLPPPYIESTPPQLQPPAASSSFQRLLSIPIPLHVTLLDGWALVFEVTKAAAHNIKVVNRELTKKRKRDDPATRSLQSQGRGIRKVAAMFGEISTILADAEEYAKHPYPDDEEDDGDEDDETERSEEDENAERNLEAALEINRLVPNLKQMVAKYKKKDDLSPLVHYFTAASVTSLELHDTDVAETAPEGGQQRTQR